MTPNQVSNEPRASVTGFSVTCLRKGKHWAAGEAGFLTPDPADAALYRAYQIAPVDRGFVASGQACPMCFGSLLLCGNAHAAKLCRVIKSCDGAAKRCTAVMEPLPESLEALRCVACDIWFFQPRESTTDGIS